MTDKNNNSSSDHENRNEGKGKMTVSEAGHLGGEKGGKATAETHGHEFYSEIGHKGGETVKEERGPEFYSEIGKKGGEQVREAFEAKRKEEGKNQ
jgi:general stress protein YciG